MSQMFRARVVRADGRAINVVQRRAHLSYCFKSCCCGRTERGYAPVPVETFKEEWLQQFCGLSGTYDELERSVAYYRDV